MSIAIEIEAKDRGAAAGGGDRIEPFSFKVAQLKFEKCSHRFVFVRYLNLSRFRTFIYATLKAKQLNQCDFNASKNFRSRTEELSVIIEIK